MLSLFTGACSTAYIMILNDKLGTTINDNIRFYLLTQILVGNQMDLISTRCVSIHMINNKYSI